MGLSHPSHILVIVKHTSVGDRTQCAPGCAPARTASSETNGHTASPFGRLLGVLRVLRHRPVTAQGADGLGACLRAVRAARAWLDAYEAEVLAEAERRDVPRETGAVDTAGWLRGVAGVSRREALARARTAVALEELHEVGAALAAGRITHGHVQALTQVALPAEVDLSIDPDLDFPTTARRIAEAARGNQEELIRAAESMSVEEFRRFLRRWADLAAGDDGGERDLRQRKRRSVTTFESDDGLHGVRALLPADQFAVFENELRRLAEARWRAEHPDTDGVPARELSCPQRNADALVEMARRSRQLGHNNGEPLGSHIDVMVLIDAETLQQGMHAHSRCELDDTTPLSPAAARRLLCDADILTAALDRPSLKLDLGYSRRSASPSLRRALIARDHTCTAPGCDRPHWMCEIHHIIPWAAGGPTDLDNLTLLCSRHHHLHHANEGRIIGSRQSADPPRRPARPPYPAMDVAA